MAYKFITWFTPNQCGTQSKGLVFETHPLQQEEKLIGGGKWSHVDYVIIKICVMSL